jgi:hypothetical protein
MFTKNLLFLRPNPVVCAVTTRRYRDKEGVGGAYTGIFGIEVLLQ